MYIEEWPCRFIACFESASAPDRTETRPLGLALGSVSEGHQRAAEMLEVARREYGARLRWIEIQQLDEDGAWSSVGRFYPGVSG